mmetsp:Transcript_30869/g.47262  ORF Transcript_30869/g.47262 Transcript_30869/m.47262 type:complete len:85 (-) Transcript_30869:20-274(-)
MKKLDGDQSKQVLVQQIYDIEIEKKKKEMRKNFLQNPPQSHRQNPPPQVNFGGFLDQENSNIDFKSHSLKNSQSIRASQLTANN